MRLEVAGKDRSSDIGCELLEEAGRRSASPLSVRVERELPILDLKSAACVADYQDVHVDLLRARSCVDPSRFRTPVGRGPGGRLRHLLRRFFWKLLRYQYDWLAFEQNAINVQLAYELEFERDLRRKQIAALTDRIRRLEDATADAGEPTENDSHGDTS
jgi:hypothetical protein